MVESTEIRLNYITEFFISTLNKVTYNKYFVHSFPDAFGIKISVQLKIKCKKKINLILHYFNKNSL